MKTALLVLALALPVLSQVPLSFEVVSIKPAERVGPINSTPGGLFIASGQTLRGLITFAYKAGPFHVLGGPGWIDTNLWQIEAKPADGAIPPGTSRSETDDKINVMVQSMLKDRFQLRIHRKTRELPIYELVIARGGLKMKLSDDQTDPVPQPFQLGAPMPRFTRGTFRMGGGRIEGSAVKWDVYVNLVFKNSALFDRPITDKTNLNSQDRYDMKLDWTPGNSVAAEAAGGDSTSIFTAIQEQLGLRLISTKGPVNVLMVDSAEKPDRN